MKIGMSSVRSLPSHNGENRGHSGEIMRALSRRKLETCCNNPADPGQVKNALSVRAWAEDFFDKAIIPLTTARNENPDHWTTGSDIHPDMADDSAVQQGSISDDTESPSLEKGLEHLARLNAENFALSLLRARNVYQISDEPFGGPTGPVKARYYRASESSISIADKAIQAVIENPPEIITAEMAKDDETLESAKERLESNMVLPHGISAAFLPQDVAEEMGISSGENGVILASASMTQKDLNRELRDAIAAKASELGFETNNYWNWSEIA